MTETYTLLVHEVVPEETKLYLIPNEVANKHRNYLDLSAGCFINQEMSTEQDKACDIVSALIAERPHSCLPNCQQYACLWKDYFVPGCKIAGKNITAVYVTGFIL